MIKNEEDLPFDYTNYRGTFLKKLAKQYNAGMDCGAILYNTGCVIKNEDGVFDYYKSYTGGSIAQEYFDDGGFISTDGTTFFVEQGTQAQRFTGYLVSIDVNGHKKRPNKMGYDLFMFHITQDGKVLPMGADGTYWGTNRKTYCSNTSTSSNNGFTCSYYAMTDKNYFKNLR